MLEGMDMLEFQDQTIMTLLQEQVGDFVICAVSISHLMQFIVQNAMFALKVMIITVPGWDNVLARKTLLHS